MENFRVTDNRYCKHSHHHVRHIIMSTARHQVAEKCVSSACELTSAGENTLGRETLLFLGKVVSLVAEVGSLCQEVRVRSAKFVDKKCAGM